MKMKKALCSMLTAAVLAASVSAPAWAYAGKYQAKSVYQNPSGYFQITDENVQVTDAELKKAGYSRGYSLSVGSVGNKVKTVMQALRKKDYLPNYMNGYDGYWNEKTTKGYLGGALYGEKVENAVKKFQKKKGLKQTGVVDKATWLKLGESEAKWTNIELYVSPTQSSKNNSKKQCIETALATAEKYYDKKTRYVLGGTCKPGEDGRGIDCIGLVFQGLYSAGLDMGGECNPVQYCHQKSHDHHKELACLWKTKKMKHIDYEKHGIDRGDIIVYCNGSGAITHYAFALNSVSKKHISDCKVIEAYPGGIYKNIPIKANGNKSYKSSYGQKHYVDHSRIKGVLRPFLD